MLKKKTHPNFDNTRDESTHTTEQDCLCILSRKKFYEIFVENVSKARENLLLANTAKGVEDALNAVDTLILSYSNAPYVDGSIAEHIHGALSVVRKVRMHDLKRGSLANSLALLLKDAKAIIEEEEKKEQQHWEAIQSLLMEMAEHVPEISALVDFDKIFKNLG